MMTTETLELIPEDKLIKRALQALLVVLGPAEVTRFLALNRMGRIESVMRHLCAHLWHPKGVPGIL